MWVLGKTNEERRGLYHTDSDKNHPIMRILDLRLGLPQQLERFQNLEAVVYLLSVQLSPAVQNLFKFSLKLKPLTNVKPVEV